MDKNRTGSGENFVRKDDFEVQQDALWRWASERVPSWGKVQEDDYDFRSWTNGASKELLKASCLYEYVRESSKLRCLIALMNPARKRRNFEYYTLGHGRYKRSCSFEGLGEDDARKILGSALRWLTGFAKQLADNSSFAELVCTRQDLEQSIARHPIDFPIFKAVQLAIPLPGDNEPPWPWQPWSSKLFTGETGPQGFPLIELPDRHIRDDGSEKIAIEIRWRDFSNRKIGKAMEGFARAQRPKVWKKPKREPPEKIFRAKLNALSVMRIWKRFPHREDRWNRIEEVGECTGFKSCMNVSRSLDTGTSNAASVEISRARDAALRFFRSLGTGEIPANWVGER